MEANIEKLRSLPVTDNVSADVRAILREARRTVVRQINFGMTAAYWLIGRRIVAEEQGGRPSAKYGEQLLKKLSKELTADFGNGFSYANLRNMRQFYRIYPDFKICYTLCSKLTWSHNRLIMRCPDPDARNWYLREAVREGWSVRQLERNINSFFYRRQLEAGSISAKTEDSDAGNPGPDSRQIVKDPYVLEL